MVKNSFFIAGLVTLLCLVVSPLYPQFANLDFGVKGGLNIANTNQGTEEIIPELYGEKQLYPTAGGGVFIEYPFTPSWAAQIDLQYNKKGTTFSGTQVMSGVGIIDFEVNEGLDYLTVAVLPKYYLGSGRTRPYVMAGPEIGILLDAEVRIDVDVMVVDLAFDSTMNIKNDLKSTDFGVKGAAGVEFPVTSFMAFFEVGYSLGLINISRMEGEDIKNYLFSLQAGIKF